MIVYTGGSFDLFHYGHARFLHQCFALTVPRFTYGPRGRVVVSLNTDEFIEAYKGRPPVIPYAERKEVLEACRWVDEVILNSGGEDSKPAIEAVKPDVIAIGSDWVTRDYYLQMGFTPTWLKQHGIRLMYLDYTPQVSSSLIRQAL